MPDRKTWIVRTKVVTFTVKADAVTPKDGLVILTQGQTPVAFVAQSELVSIVDASALDTAQATSYG